MENESLLSAQSSQRLVGGPARPADLNAIRDTLERQVSRLRELKYRAGDLGDQMFGSRVQGISASGCSEAPVSNFVDLLGELSDQIDGLSDALARF